MGSAVRRRAPWCRLEPLQLSIAISSARSRTASRRVVMTGEKKSYSFLPRKFNFRKTELRTASRRVVILGGRKTALVQIKEPAK